MNKQEIPLMFCFDNNYVIPAAVAFYSLLEHANKDYKYTMYVLHTDISYENQEKLQETIKPFSDFAELIFVDMENKFEGLWDRIATKGHFSKEVMYKVLVASIFPKYDKIIVSDVDVVFLNDISQSYFDLDVSEDYYLAGVKMIGKMKWYLDQYLQWFTEEEVEIYENHITINNEVSPVRAVFCDDTDTDGTFSIYLTSAAIDYFEEIGEARSYVGITIDKDCLGREINISSSENRYEIGYYDNFSNTAKTASSEELSVFASGTFTVSENGEGGYGVSVDAVLPGTAISVRYDGPAKSVMESPGPAANEFTFSGGSPVAIMSAVLDRNGSIDGTWELYLSPVPGCTGIEQMNGNFVHISAWDYCFDGDIYGFSQHRGEGFYVEYGDTVWSSVLDSEDSSTGTLEAVIDGNTISVDFYNLSDGTDTLEGHYAGPVTIIEEGQI